MIDSPDAVYIIIPAMKNLNMSWREIKQTPRYEVMGLIAAFNQYEILHAYDGYTDGDISSLSKDKPELRSAYNKSMSLKAKYETSSGKRREEKKFSHLVRGY
tara:strand:+ start:364 stop:669 length:306 start_codon:yes stop_codon:yes gene_type:complete